MVGAGLFVWSAVVTRDLRSERLNIERQRRNLGLLRTASHECVAEVEQAQGRLESQNTRVDSLRAVVREMESLDPRGVPSERYEAYLETLEAYNLSTDAWQARADTLAARRDRCETLVRYHNALQDTVEAMVRARSARN